MYRALVLLVSVAAPAFIFAAEERSPNSNRSTSSSVFCVMPEYPEHGSYQVLSQKKALISEPVQNFHFISLIYRCQQPYQLFGSSNIICVLGHWLEPFPTCIQCGYLASNGSNGQSEHSSQSDGVPWYAAIYTKKKMRYMQICAGTLVSPSAVLSAAQCFWNMADKLYPKENYAVALGKKYRRWENKKNETTHRSDVNYIYVPPQFLEQTRNFKNDIAVVVMVNSVVYTENIRPICLSFDLAFQKTHSNFTYTGKVGYWDLNSKTSRPSHALKVVNINYVPKNTCLVMSPAQFRPYVTEDKICGYSSAIPHGGDAGAGLAIPSLEGGMDRYFLRGIASVISTIDNADYTMVGFTDIRHHEYFIKYYVMDENNL